jgi:hypothetical protein
VRDLNSDCQRFGKARVSLTTGFCWQGLDAAEMLGLAAPDAAYVVQYPSVDANEMTAARQELQGMKLTALQKRALREGLAAHVVDEALDADEPKAALIQLILDNSQRCGSRFLAPEEGVPPLASGR